MLDRLDRTERRILGVLAEKELTTPNAYPLSTNALLNGCNQKSNRDPVLLLQEFEVEGSLRQLQIDNWVINVSGAGSRVVKWKHRLRDRLDLDEAGLAVIAELLLRGAQSPGSLRAHVARMAPIPDLAALNEVLGPLENRGLIRSIPPAPGERSRRWDHLLYPEDEVTEFESTAVAPAAAPAPTTRLASRSSDASDITERLGRIEQRLDRLERELGLDANDEDHGDA